MKKSNKKKTIFKTVSMITDAGWNKLFYFM